MKDNDELYVNVIRFAIIIVILVIGFAIGSSIIKNAAKQINANLHNIEQVVNQFSEDYTGTADEYKQSSNNSNNSNN